MAVAETYEQRILAVDDVITADVPVIPVLDDGALELEIVKEELAIGIRDGARRSAIRLGVGVEIILRDGVQAVGGDYVGLRAIAHELQSAIGIGCCGGYRAV